MQRPGRLKGTPGLGDVGTFAGIVIGVSDGSKSAKLAPLRIKVQGDASGLGALDVESAAERERHAKPQKSKATRCTGARRRAAMRAPRRSWTRAQRHTSSKSLTPNTYHFVVKSINSTGDEKVYSRPKSVTIP